MYYPPEFLELCREQNQVYKNNIPGSNKAAEDRALKAYHDCLQNGGSREEAEKIFKNIMTDG